MEHPTHHSYNYLRAWRAPTRLVSSSELHRMVPEMSAQQETREPDVAWVNTMETNATLTPVFDEPINTTATTNTTSTTSPTATPPLYYSKVDTIVTCILIVLIVMLCVNLLVLLYKPTRRYILRKYRTLDHVQQRRTQRRYHTIDQWLVRKQVQPHDAICVRLQECATLLQQLDHSIVCHKLELQCNKCPNKRTNKLGNITSTTINMSGETSSHCSSSSNCSRDHPPDSLHPSSSSMDDDNDKLSCSICLERFAINQQLAWSPNPRCCHVYHHSCLRDWLLRKTACPYCREMVLPIDKLMEQKRENENDNVEAQQTLQQIMETDSDSGRSVALTSPNRSFDNEEDNENDIENGDNSGENNQAPQQQQTIVANDSKSKQPPKLSRQEHHLQCLRQRSRRIKTTYFCVECGLVDLAEKATATKSMMSLQE